MLKDILKNAEHGNRAKEFIGPKPQPREAYNPPPRPIDPFRMEPQWRQFVTVADNVALDEYVRRQQRQMDEMRQQARMVAERDDRIRADLANGIIRANDYYAMQTMVASGTSGAVFTGTSNITGTAMGGVSA